MTLRLFETELPTAVRSVLPDLIKIEYLGHGTRNHHWRLFTPSSIYIWRQFGLTPPGASRDNERQVLKQLQGFTWVPELILEIPDGILFRAEREIASSAQYLTAGQREQLVQTVIDLWQQPCHFPPMDYVNLIQQYAFLAKGFDQHQIEVLLNNTSNWRIQDFCLIHQDIHADNLLITAKGVQLLDWEYASCGNPWIDAVSLDRMLHLSDHEKQRLTAYLPEICHSNPWQHMREWLNTLDALWQRAQISQSMLE